jgi:2,5-diamino-6-(ribosylamino)-4(3H)-pyrimidinone 5'-phosphate reductase
MVGVRTVIADDPSLTIKSEQLQENRTERGDSPHPARVIADSQVRTPPDSAVFDGQAATYLLVSETVPTDCIDQIEEMGATVISAGENQVDLARALEKLAAHGIDQVLIEGGGEIIYSLFEAELVDRVSVFVGSLIIGGREAPTLADGEGFTAAFPRLELEAVNRVDDGVVLEYTVL